MELILQVWLLILDLEVTIPILTISWCLTMNFILKQMMEITELNCGSMMELMLQVWLLILDREVVIQS